MPPVRSPLPTVPAPTRARVSAAPKRKGLPFKWLLLGGVVFALIFTVLLAAGLFAGVGKLKEYGYDPELARKYPALAAFVLTVKIEATVDDLQVDKDNGTATFREKRSGRKVIVREVHGLLKREYIETDKNVELQGLDPSERPKPKFTPKKELKESF